MQKFDIPSQDTEPKATPSSETPSKRRSFSMMEAKPAPREVPAKETPSALRAEPSGRSQRPSLRLIKPQAEIEEVKHVASLRRSVAEVRRPVNDVDKLRAKIKSLRGRIETKIGHQVTGTAKEIQANLSFGESVKARVGSWLSGIAGKKTESSNLNDLLNQLNLAEKTLDIRLTPDVSVIEPAPLSRKPKTLRNIKSRIEELEAGQAAEADKTLEEVHVEVVEPEAPKEGIGTKIEMAKAGLKRAEIKTSPLAESVRMPEEEGVDVDLSELNEEVREPERLQKTHFEGLIDGDLANTDILQPGTPLYEFRGQGKVYEKLTELGELIKAEEARADKLTEEIDALNKKFKKSPRAKRPNIQEQIDAKVSELYDNEAFLSKQDALLAEAIAKAEELKKESSPAEVTLRPEDLEPVEESISKKAPPPPSAEERKRREKPTIEVGEGELTPEEMKVAYGEEEIKFEEPKVQFEEGVAQEVAARRKKIMETPTLRAKEKADVYQDLRQELMERVRDEEQIGDYINLASKRDRAYKENDEQAAATLQKRIDTFNTAWRGLGIIGDNEDPSVSISGKSGIGRMGVIGSDLITQRAARGRQTEVLPTGVREKTRSKLEKTAARETKELQPFNTAWAIEKLGVGAAKRWDLVAPVVMEAELGVTIEREINNMLKKIENLANSEKDLFSDEYRDLPRMMNIVRHTERFNQSPETAAYIFLRALSPKNFSDYLAQDIVESALGKLDQEIAAAEQESARKKEIIKREEEQGFSMMRAKPPVRGTIEKKPITLRKPVVPKAKRGRTIMPGKSEAA